MKKLKSILELIWALLGLFLGRCPKSRPPDKCPMI